MAVGKLLSICAALGTLAFASPSAPDPKPAAQAPEAKDVCKQGRSLYSSGDVVRAAKALTHCVEQEPRNREAWTALANADLEAGRFAQSAEAFARAEALKPGDDAFLNAYLSALEGAGRDEDRIPVLRKLAARKSGDRQAAERLLAAVEASGVDRHADDYLFALQILGDGPRAERFHVEKLAAAYLKRKDYEKAEAEYRWLLEKSPESPEGWAGLGSALALSDPQAASDCYRKAALYSNHAEQRAGYLAERDRLAKASPEVKPSLPQDVKETALAAPTQEKAIAPKAAPAAEKNAVAKTVPAPEKIMVAKAAPVAEKPPVAKAVPTPEKPATAKVAAGSGLDLKAFQDSVYRAELAKQLAARHIKKADIAAVTAPGTQASPVVAVPAPGKPAQSQPPIQSQAEKNQIAIEEKRQKEDARKQAEAEKLAKAEKTHKDSLDRAAEAKATAEAKAKEDAAKRDAMAKAEKARQESQAKADKARSDSLKAVADRKGAEEKLRQEALAKADRARQDSLARADKARQEAMAKAEKARNDSLARVAETKAKEEKARQDAVAKAEKARQESQAKADKVRSDSLKAVADRKAAEEKIHQEALAKARKDSLDRVAEAKAKEDAAKREAVAKADKARQDSLARADKARQEALAKADKARQDSLVKVAEAKSKADKARQDSLVRVTEAKAKAEKAKQDSLAMVAVAKAKADKAKQDSLVMVAEAKAKADKARQDSLAQVAKVKAKADKARQDSLAQVAMVKAKADKARQDSLAQVAVAKAKAEKVRQDSLARVAESIARAEKARQDSLARADKARLERERLARERRDRFDRAYAHYRAGRLDSSALLFKAVLADSPVADAWYYAGRVQLAKGDFSRALELFERAASDKPDIDGLKGKALLGMGKPKDALKPLQAQYTKDKNDSLLEDIIAAKRKIGDEAGAITTLEELATRRPGSLKVQTELAAYWRSKGVRAKATERYNHVFTLDPKDGEANYWLGMEAIQSNGFVRAAPLLERAVIAFPTRADAWKGLAKADLALGRRDAAWEAHRKALALSPNDLELAKGRLALARESHPNELAQAYEEVLRLSPGDTSAAMGLARLRYGRGDYAGAEKDFRIALKDSKDGQAWAEFGRTLLELKKSDEAAAALQKAVDLGEKDPSLHLDLARIRIDKGDLDGAEALVKDLAKQSPRDAEAQYWLGQIALKRQQTQVAEEFFRKAHQLQPDHAKYAESLAQALRDKDEFKQALAVLSQAEPSLSPGGKLLFGECLARSGDPGKAIEVYAALFAKQPSAQLLARRMDLLVLAGKAEQAVELTGASPYAQSNEVRYALAKAQLNLAESHVLKGDVDQAVDLMKQVVKSDDHRPEYHYYLGLGFFDQARWKKAVDEFGEALTYRVDYPEALYRKGLCLLKTGDAKEAGDAFTELSQHADAQWKARGLYGMAMVFEADGKTEAVQHHLELSIAAAAQADAMADLARILLKQGKVPEAQEWARRALAIDHGHEAATVALGDALAASKKQDQAMELARAGLKVKPLSCGLLVQSAKLNFEAGRIDSSLVASNVAMKNCPTEPMAYYYAGVATRSSNRSKEAKQYFKTFRKLGGDGKMVPEE
ncbi:MAG: tetratricopeptide repeat protein [Fibrobacteres bacterium]|nr:tetratricopeptide repeat protein [Fibrobacterota bacterium]